MLDKLAERVVDDVALNYGALGLMVLVVIALLIVGNIVQWKLARQRELENAAKDKIYLENYHELSVQSTTAMTELSTLIRDRGRV